MASAATLPLCCRTVQAKSLDGRLEEWQEREIIIDKSYWHPVLAQQPVYGGANDLFATLRMAWDKENLYLAVTVRDDFLMPAKSDALDRGDSVLLTFAPARVRKDIVAAPVELALSATHLSLVYQRGKNGKWLPREDIKLGFSRHHLTVPKLAMPREAGKKPPKFITKTCYELAIPWKILPAITPRVGNTFGLLVQVLDTDDGKTLRGSLKWRGNHGLPRTPTGFGQVQFAPPVGK